MAGLSSWEIAEEIGVSHASMLNWARAIASIQGSVPQRERRLVAVDETELKVNGRIVYVWAAMDVDIRELLALEATWGRSAAHALFFLRKVLERCTNRPTFVVDRGPWYGWASRSLGLSYYHETFGIRSRIERFFRTLKRRTKVFANNVNARRLHVRALNIILSIFQMYYNWLRYHKGIGGMPALSSMGGDLIWPISPESPASYKFNRSSTAAYYRMSTLREIAELSGALSDDDFYFLSSLAKFLGRRRYVQVDVISKVTGRPEDIVLRSLRKMHRMRLVTRSSAGYSLVYAGLDALALHSLQRAGRLDALGIPIAVGKESDVYSGIVGEREVAVKAYRIGRVSFRRLKRLRIYGPHTHEWLLASMQSAAVEFRNLRRMSTIGLPVPKPLALRYHLLVMERIDGVVLRYMDEVDDPLALLWEILDAIRRCYLEARLVHADLNEFNVMVGRRGVFILDWPQAVDAGNPAASTYLAHDLDNMARFFRKRFNVVLDRESALDYVIGRAERAPNSQRSDSSPSTT